MMEKRDYRYYLEVIYVPLTFYVFITELAFIHTKYLESVHL